MRNEITYDPIALAKAVEHLISVDRGGCVERKYFRFRSSRFYGGSAVADATGCNLRCVYCWNYTRNARLVGEFFKPSYVASALLSIAKAHGHRFVRVSGGEPTLAFNHLLQVLEHLSKAVDEKNIVFVLETNGILLGYNKHFAEMLSRYSFVWVRISLKGCSEEEFQIITGAKKEFYKLQLQALKNLIEYNIKAWVSVPISLCNKKSFADLLSRLEKVDPSLVNNLEFEYLKLYPSVLRRLCRKGLKPWIAIHPSKGVVKEGDFDELCRGRECD